MSIGNKKLLVALAAATVLAVGVWQGLGHLQDKKMSEQLLSAPMHTLCVGRYLIDVPAQYGQENYRYRISGVEFQWLYDIKSEAEFDQKLAAREEELKKAKNAGGATRLERVEVLNNQAAAGKVLYFDRTLANSGGGLFGADGRRLDFDNEEGLTAEAWLWMGSHAVRLEGKDLAVPRSIGNVARLAAPLRALAPNEIPDEPGYCMEMAQARFFIAGEPAPEQNEMTEVQFGLKDRPDVKFDFTMFTNGDELSEPLSVRQARARKKLGAAALALTTLRAGPRTIHGMEGDEDVVSVRELNGTKGHSFGWEPLGRPNDPIFPQIVFDMKTGYSHDGPVQSSLSDEAALKLWDAVAGSIRLRPTTPPKVVEPPKAPLGTVSTTGYICPQSGLWCAEEGEQRFITEGERMPKARIAVAPNLWQRLRGEHPIGELATHWTLVAFEAPAAEAPSAPAGEVPAPSEQEPPAADGKPPEDQA